MVTLVYVAAYAGTLLCIGIIATKVINYLQKPVHVRWELYPVAHEPGRASYGGSYLEDVGWWKEKRKSSFLGGMLALLQELLFLHATMEHNPKLWYRTYPFHFGLYMLLGGLFLTIIAALGQIMNIEPGLVLTAIGNLVQVLSFLGFCGIIIGGASLFHRRLTQEDLRKYSTREHFINLAAFVLLGALGLLAWLGNPSFFALGRDFMVNFLTLSFLPPGSDVFSLYLIWGFILAAYVPATHMGHFFMKYFLYHDIRWGDQPTQDNPKTQAGINTVLGYPVDWKAPHINGDGKKSWGEVATTNPTDTPEKK